MRTTLLASAALLAVGLGAGGANAIDYCTSSSGVIDVGGFAYVVLDSFMSHSYVFSFYLYAETNGEPGLQRGGADPLGYADVCQNTPNPDFLVFDPTVESP